MNGEKIPSIMIAAPSSGSGKTVITCGLLQAWKNRGLNPAGFKCGPDYIDPLFHREVLGVESGNLDGFFQDQAQMEESLFWGSRGADVAVIEGVMGYFDGLGGITSRASSWETAAWLDCPVILVVDGRGAGLSAAAAVQGFLEFQPGKERRPFNGIEGILLNRVSPGMYPVMKKMLEERFSIPVVGYVPKLDWLHIESRHLGLRLPGEIADLKAQLSRFAGVLEETVDLELLLQIAGDVSRPENKSRPGKEPDSDNSFAGIGTAEPDCKTVTIGVAWDEAFCFYYRDNLRLLRQAGARLEFFSPLHQEKLPEGTDGLLIGGGYPELYARQLSENQGMCRAIREAALDGMPILGECGGFLYLQESLEDGEGTAFPMVGALPGAGFSAGKLGRFGYVTLSAKEDGIYLKEGDQIRAHEFHYWDSDECGELAEAGKPVGKRKWMCMRRKNRILAGFPHLYYPSFPKLPERFVEECRKYSQERQGI